jgi:integrase
MPRPQNAVPVYRRHRATNQAVCTVRLASGGRKDLYLGRWNSPASKAEHNRVVAVVAANHGVYPDDVADLTVSEALARYARHIDATYIDADGKPLPSVKNIKSALSTLRVLFGETSVADFGPPQLKACREALVKEGRVRRQVNKRTNEIRRFFKWCVEEQVVPPATLEALRAVAPLMPGRGGVAEGEPRRPADPVAVEKVIPFLPPGPRAVIRLLRITGARPSEIMKMKPGEIERTGEIWRYTPTVHKGTWRGKGRTIFLNQQAKDVLAPWLLGCPDASYIFSPRRSEAMRSRERAERRVTPRYRSHLARNEQKRAKSRKLPPAERYDKDALARALARACERANVTAFTAYQLRHLKAVELREQFNLETVRAVLGQSTMSMAEHYARAADESLARKAAEIG